MHEGLGWKKNNRFSIQHKYKIAQKISEKIIKINIFIFHYLLHSLLLFDENKNIKSVSRKIQWLKFNKFQSGNDCDSFRLSTQTSSFRLCLWNEISLSIFNVGMKKPREIPYLMEFPVPRILWKFQALSKAPISLSDRVFF